jgi:hypothetical protein
MIKYVVVFLIAICICISVVSAESEYCTPPPTGMNVSIIQEGDWFNITITNPECYICIDNGGGYGDVDCTPCPSTTFTSNVTCGIGTFGVSFTEHTGFDNATTDYYWDFGDGNTSIDQNPNTTYSTPGVYDVKFMTDNPFRGIEWDNKTGYMKARAFGDTCDAATKKYSTQMSQDPSMVYIIAFGAFVVFIVLLAMGMRRR